MTITACKRITNAIGGTAAALAVAAGLAAAPLDAAEAGSKHGRYLAAGAIGLATGAIIGGAIASQPRGRVIIYDAPRAYRLQPWTPAWYSHCSRKYRSFNPETGHYLGYDGRYHFCR